MGCRFSFWLFCMFGPCLLFCCVGLFVLFVLSLFGFVVKCLGVCMNVCL